MANLSAVDAPFGMRPIRHSNGAPYNGAVNPYYLKVDYNTAMFIGDPVIKTNDGTNAAFVNVGPGGAGFEIGTLPVINKCSVNTADITGVIVSFGALPNDLTKQYNPVKTERVVFVADDPDLIFEIQANAAVTATLIGENASLIFAQSGDTATGLSGVEMDVATANSIATTAGLQLSLRRASSRVDNAIGDLWPIMEVKINRHTEVGGTVGKTGI